MPIMLAVFQQADAGSFSLDDRLTIRNEFTSIADGSLFSLDIADDSDKSLYERIGETETIRELTRLMIVRSSNLATNLLVDLIQAKPADNFIARLGIAGITVIRGVEDKAAYRAGLNNIATAPGRMSYTLLILVKKKSILFSDYLILLKGIRADP